MSFNITEDEYKRLILRIEELESTMKEVITISPSYELALKIDEVIAKTDNITAESDRLRSRVIEYIEKVNDNPQKAPTLLEAYENAGVSLSDIAQVFKINISYVQKILDGSSDNKSLKKRVLNYLVNMSLSK